MLRHVLTLVLVVTAQQVSAEEFAYFGPGKLQPSPTGMVSGAGDVANRKIYAPDIGLPVKLGPGEGIYPNSQVYRPGGMNGGAGGACDKSNYAMPWADTFCEKRERGTLLCPGGKGHQGLDIRPPVCKDKASIAIAVEDGTIIGRNDHTSSVTLKGARTGTVYLYLHLDPPNILVKVNQKVKAGDSLGKISNFINGAHDTTVHLHFEIKQNVEFNGSTVFTHVPPYPSLVHAYRQKLGLPSLNNEGVLDADAAREK